MVKLTIKIILHESILSVGAVHCLNKAKRMMLSVSEAVDFLKLASRDCFKDSKGFVTIREFLFIYFICTDILPTCMSV